MASGDLSKQLLSGSTNGKGIKVTGTNSGAAVTVHTPDASAKDEIFVSAYNDDTAAILLTIEFGGTTDPDNVIEMSIPGNGVGLVPVIPGLVLTGAAQVVKAFAATANKIVLYGFVNRID